MQNNYGGAVKLVNSSPLITQCLFFQRIKTGATRQEQST